MNLLRPSSLTHAVPNIVFHSYKLADPRVALTFLSNRSPTTLPTLALRSSNVALSRKVGDAIAEAIEYFRSVEAVDEGRLMEAVTDHVAENLNLSDWVRHVAEQPVNLDLSDWRLLTSAEIKSIKPLDVVAVSEEERRTLAKSSQLYFDTLTGRLGKSPLTGQNILKQEREDPCWLYNALVNKADLFYRQYLEKEAQQFKTVKVGNEEKSFTLQVNERLFKICLLHHLNDKRVVGEAREANVDLDAQQVLLREVRDFDSGYLPAEETVVSAFGLRLSKPSAVTQVINPSPVSGMRNLATWEEMTAIVQDVPLAVRTYKSYLMYIGGLNYALTRELGRAIGRWIDGPTLITGIDSFRLYSYLKGIGVITITHASVESKDDYSDTVIVTGFPKGQSSLMEFIANHPRAKQFLLLGHACDTPRGWHSSQVSDISKHVLTPEDSETCKYGTAMLMTKSSDTPLITGGNDRPRMLAKKRSSLSIH